MGCFWVSIYCSRTAWCNLRTTVEKKANPGTFQNRTRDDVSDNMTCETNLYFQNKKGIFFSGNSYNGIFLAIDVAKGTSTFCWIMISLWRDYEEKPSHGTRNFVKNVKWRQIYGIQFFKKDEFLFKRWLNFLNSEKRAEWVQKIKMLQQLLLNANFAL